MFNKFKKNKATKISTAPSTPRSMDEINIEYGRLVAQAGQAQYQVHVHAEDLKRLNEQLRSLNYEAAARNKLDADKPAETESKAGAQ